MREALLLLVAVCGASFEAHLGHDDEDSGGEFNPDIRDAFTQIYKTNKWLELGLEQGGSRSGHSSVVQTVQLRRALRTVIDEFNITSMLDAPCGDMIYMSHFLDELQKEKPEFRYEGVDIVEHVIEENKRRYADRNWQFRNIDVSLQPVEGKFDLIYSRAMLQHLPRDTVSDVLRIFNASGAKYVLMTTYLNCANSGDMDVDKIVKGYFAAHNYMMPPFSLHFPLRFYLEDEPSYPGSYPGMYLGLWKLPFSKNPVLP